MRTFLALSSGLMWTITYVLIIWRSHRDRTYGMPLVALGANLSWEFVFAFVHPSGMPQRAVNIVWFLLDVVILVMVLRFGVREFPGIPRPLFRVGVAATLVLTYLGVVLFAGQFDQGRATIVAFAQNLMMSALFLSMLYARFRSGGDPLRGQSVWIGITKLVGTAFASAMVFFLDPRYDGSALMVYLYVVILLLDAAYVAAVLAVEQNAARTRPGGNEPVPEKA